MRPPSLRPRGGSSARVYERTMARASRVAISPLIEAETKPGSLGGLEELEDGHCGGIEVHGIARGKSLQPREMAQRLALGLAEIGDRAAGGLKPRGHVAHSEALEGRHLELGGQRLPSRLEREPR